MTCMHAGMHVSTWTQGCVTFAYHDDKSRSHIVAARFCLRCWWRSSDIPFLAIANFAAEMASVFLNIGLSIL